MKMGKKLQICLLSLFFLLLAVPLTVRADELPLTDDGKEVVLTDFEILDEKISFYDFESKFPLYDIYDDMLEDMDVEGIKCKLSYTVGGVDYETTSTIAASNDSEGIKLDLDGLDWDYTGLNIFVTWKNYSTKKVDGEICYKINTKNNAWEFQCGDKVVEVPVEFNVPTPVKEIKIVKNPWEKGIYEYKYEETLGRLDYSGLKFKIVYKDGSSSSTISSSEDMWEIREKSGHEIIISSGMIYDEDTGEETDNAFVTIRYMGVEEKIEIPILQNAIEKMELTKNPEKMVYKIPKDTPDLYGATLEIIYRDGSKETIKIKSHKTKIPVKNTYNDSIKLSYSPGHININYLGEQLNVKVKTNVSKLGKTTAITAGKSKTETIEAKTPTRVYTLTANKTGRYKMSFSGEKIRLKSGGKGNKRKTEFTVYVLNKDGYLEKTYYDDSDGDENNVHGLKKGQKYYFYVYIDKDQYYSDDDRITPLYKQEFTSKVSYLSGLVKQNIKASDVTKKYTKDAFFLDAKADSGAELTYSSSDKKVATIAKNGEVQLKGPGTTTITIKAPAKGIYKSASKTITLKVTKGDANIKVKKASYTKAIGSKAFYLSPSAETALTYKSSNTKVATVNSKGKVTIKACGKSVITITGGDEKYKKSTKKVTIQVTPKKVTIKTAKSKKAGQLTLAWNKQKEAKGYVIEYSTDKKFKKNVKTVVIKKNETITKTLTGLQKKTTYYVRVKPYIAIDGKRVCGEASKLTSVEVK